ncbi:hypothetical protein L1049_008815 [Liquidambar formosana]|uniref:Uncharacterized protein n=1 Tax=Liquidambar formosana TaxID=63359 RepID=A0AAP0SA05_LIQFO
MDSKRGRSISGQKGNQLQGSWIPVTPVKPILPRPQPIYADRQLNQLGQANWVGSDAFPPGFAPENQARRIVACCDSTNYAEVNRGVNHWEAALAAKSQGPSDNAGTNDPIWNNIPFVDLLAQADSASTTSQLDVGAASSPFMSNLNFQFIGDWLQSSSANLMHANKDLSLGSNLHINSNCTQGVPHYELPIPFRHAYDLNAPPGTIPDEVSSRTISQFAPITPDQSKRAENKHISYPARPMAVEASSKTIPQFAPITPDQARRVEKEHVSEAPKLCVDERTSQESDRQNNEVATTSEVNELHCDKELSQAVGDSSFAAVSTSFKENHNPDKGGNDGIDLNKTPQQKPRRKKHRPKVITEGKPKRTRKPATPKPAGSKENPTGKRKYVRKKGLNKPPTTPPPEVAGGTTDPKTLEPTTKSCRRALNFDLDDQARVESSTCRSAFNLNGESREGHFSSGRFQSRSSVQIGHGMEMMVENTQAGIAYDLNRSTNQILKDYISLPTRQAPSTPPPTKTDPPREKLKDDAQNENGTEGTCQVIAHDKEGKSVQILPKSTAHSAPRSPSDSNCSTSTSSAEGQARGKKREYSYNTDQADPSTMNMNGAQYNSLQAYQTTFQVNEFNRFSGMHFPEIYKKKRTEKGQNSTTSSTSSSVTAAKLVRLVTERIQKDAEADHFASKANCWISASQFNTSNSPATLGEAMRGVQNTLQTFECMRALGQKERLTKKRSKGTTRVRDLASLNGIADCKLLPTLPAKRAPLDDDAQGVEISQRPHACIEALVAENSATVARKKRTKKRNSLVGSVSYSTNEVQLHQNYVLYNHHKSLDNIKGPPPEVILKHMLSIEAIVERLRCLDINKESNKFAYQEHNALVLYNTRYQGQNALVPYNMGNQEQNALVLYHRDGTVVPFEGSFDPIKKRRPRPKVDLDDETTRVWKLLLANIDSEGINGTDEEKAKWWEEERRVFRGRADSFIARMHLVQGDRRFSQWKGSVVDSVIGVFLTQNVSDHLSSSAFMSLAAHFPLRSNHQPCYEEGTGTLMEEPEVCIVDPDDTIKWNEKMSNNPICDQNSMTLHDPEHNEEKEVVSSNEIFENGTGGRYSTDDSKHKLLGSFKSDLDVYHKSTVNRSTAQIMGTEAACFIREDRGAMEDIVSSQNSVVSSHSSADSSIGQTAERIGSSSGRNSEAQDPTTRV